jgi:transposase-like protein
VVTGGQALGSFAPMSSSTLSPAKRSYHRWTAAQRTRHLAQFTASGLSATAYAREHGVPRATLLLWQREAREAADAPHATAAPRESDPPFAAVEVVPALDRAPDDPAGLRLLVRSPGGITAELTGLDTPAAAMLLQAVLTAGAA